MYHFNKEIWIPLIEFIAHHHRPFPTAPWPISPCKWGQWGCLRWSPARKGPLSKCDKQWPHGKPISWRFSMLRRFLQDALAGTCSVLLTGGRVRWLTFGIVGFGWAAGLLEAEQQARVLFAGWIEKGWGWGSGSKSQCCWGPSNSDKDFAAVKAGWTPASSRCPCCLCCWWDSTKIPFLWLLWGLAPGWCF